MLWNRLVREDTELGLDVAESSVKKADLARAAAGSEHTKTEATSGEPIMKKQATVEPGIAPAVMTVREVAAYLRVHPSTIYRLLKRGEVPGFRINGGWRFHIKTIDEWRSRMEASPS